MAGITQMVTLRREQHRWLKRRAKALGVSLAAVVREAVDDYREKRKRIDYAKKHLDA